MNGLELDIIHWQQQTFKGASKKAQNKAVLREVQELTASLVFENDDNFLEELADVIIAGIGLKSYITNKPLEEIIKEKLEVNKQRDYNKDGSRER